MTQLAKCALCKEAPLYDKETMHYAHPPTKCCQSRLGIFTKREWNIFQESLSAFILDRERKVFNVGYALCRHGEVGSGPFDFSQKIDPPQLWGEDYGDDDLNGTDAFDTWRKERGEG